MRLAESAEYFPALAAELVAMRVDLIVSATGTLAAQAAIGATRTIPIVFTDLPDPVRSGLVVSLALPGGNVTGGSGLAPQVMGKRLELLREPVPTVSRVMFLGGAGSQASGGPDEAEQAAQSLGMQLLVPSIRTVADLADAFRIAAVERAEAFLVSGGAFLAGEAGRIVEFATMARIPVLSPSRIYPEVGGLLSYGPNRLAQFRRAATYVDRILKGAKPGDLPVEQPTEFELVINLKTAQALGITVPRSVLDQATEVIQ
jgi:putative tryptophan/tyrosine transport system substrate-binding protein